MFTKTSDCLEIGDLRRTSEEYKTIPAVQFKCVTEQGDCEIMVLALKFSDPIVRLTLEAMYITAINQMSEDSLKELATKTLLPLASNVEQLLKHLHSLRDLRIDNYDGEISLNVSTDTLSSIFSVLKNKGCLSFTCGQDIRSATTVLSFDTIDAEYLDSVYGEKLPEVLSEISTNEEYIGSLSRYFYPEDCFIKRGFLRLSYINSISGNAYMSYDTLKYAYRSDAHFRENPDFFSQTHCQCGGELVIRKNSGEYTLMSCINPYCYEKMAFCLADFARAMNIDGLGATTFMHMTRGLALLNLEKNGSSEVNYQMLLKEENNIYLGDANSILWWEFLSAIENYKGTVKDLVTALNLPYIVSDASKILTGELLQNNGLTAQQLAEACSKSGKYDMKFVLNIWLNINDIRHVILNLAKSLNLEVVTEYLIYVTKSIRLKKDDGVVVNYTKKQFEDLINATLESIGQDKIRLKINNSLTHKCYALIADQERDTGSCRTAQRYGIPILTSREFIKQLGGGTIE